MIYYIADMHFGHSNVLRFVNRPFADTDQMEESLICNWHNRVTPKDMSSFVFFNCASYCAVSAILFMMSFLSDKLSQRNGTFQVLREETARRSAALMIFCGKLGEQEFRKAVAKLLEQLKNNCQKHPYSRTNPHAK